MRTDDHVRGDAAGGENQREHSRRTTDTAPRMLHRHQRAVTAGSSNELDKTPTWWLGPDVVEAGRLAGHASSVRKGPGPALRVRNGFRGKHILCSGAVGGRVRRGGISQMGPDSPIGAAQVAEHFESLAITGDRLGFVAPPPPDDRREDHHEHEACSEGGSDVHLHLPHIAGSERSMLRARNPSNGTAGGTAARLDRR